MQPVVMLVIAGVAMFSVIGGVSLLSHYYTLNGIKSRTVGDGQHGTARFATKKEIAETYVQVPYEPELWRRGENLPTAQGLVLGSMERVGKLYALVDTGDVHCLMIGSRKDRTLSVSQHRIRLCLWNEFPDHGYKGRLIPQLCRHCKKILWLPYGSHRSS